MHKFFIFVFCLPLCWKGRIIAQSCTSSLYVKNLQISTPKADYLLLLPGGSTILGGMSAGLISQVTVVKADPEGDVVWNKHIEFPQYSNITKAALTPDYKVVIAHATALALLDTNGIQLKAATVTMPPYSDLLDMKVDDAGNIVGLYTDHSGASLWYVMIKFSPDLSSVLWTQRFASYSAYFRNITIHDNQIFVSGTYMAAFDDASDGTVLNFNHHTGKLLKQVSYTIDGYKTIINNVHPTKDGYLLEGFYQPVGTPYSTLSHNIIRVNNLLQPTKAIRFTNIHNIEPLFLSTDEDGGYYGVRGTLFGGFFYCNRNDSVLWTRGVWGTVGAGIEQLARSATNLYSLEANCHTLYKTDLNGRVGGCAEINMPFETVPVSPSTLSKIPITIGNGQVGISRNSFPMTDQAFQTVTTCSYKSECSSVDIITANSLCTTGDPVKFTGRRNANCRQPVQWQVLGSPVIRDQLNDSTVSIRFLESGSYQLIARVPNDCLTIADTVTVFVSLTTTPKLNLGADRTLCAGNTVTLNARKGYASYLWQDGLTDSFYTVTEPGLYHVTVTDACGVLYKDSVLVSGAPAISIDLGPDRTKCNQDTLHISAPAGFSNYTWSNNYNISSTSSQTVVVNPLIDTSYFIKAEKDPGCFAFDTIHITVRTSPKIYLGRDTSFCEGESIALVAPTSFNKYSWNTGENTNQIVVTEAGIYNIRATTSEGCTSFDTITVTNVFPKPAVNLDKESQLCEGTSRSLDPGAFSTYVWQDGSQNRKYPASAMGTYYVTVSDQNGCIGSDTTTIAIVLPSPKSFLPADTAICSYGTITVAPLLSFQKHLWSTNSTTSRIKITSPGTYWLQATSTNGCIGRDTLIVKSKECMQGLYVPSAFSPNGDGKNDVLKALLFGDVKNFEFAIYDRWGNLVFRTTDRLKGWNGTNRSLSQATSVYVWRCKYQLAGKEIEHQQGTVTVLR